MLIGIDMSLTAEKKTGLPSYARSLVAALARIDRTNRYLLYPFVWHSFPPNYRSAFCPRQRNFRQARRGVPAALIDYLWRHSKIDNDWLIGGDPDVYFSPFHSVPPRHFKRLVSVFHDVAFRVHPEFSTQVNLEHCETQFQRAVVGADKMVTVSHFSKAEIVKHMGVPADWIAVTHEAADPMYRRIEGARIPERIRKELRQTEQTILYVGSVEPRKNLSTLVEAFRALCARGRCDAQLIIAGGSGWKNTQVYAAVDEYGLGDRVHFTGYVTDQELVELYNSTAVFVFPTIYEGFGLPVIEAMSCGTAVVTTRVASIPEIGGDAVAYVDDPYDADGLSQRLEDVLLDRELRRDLGSRGMARAATFTWERTARETLAVIEEVHRDPAFQRREVEVGRDERGLHRGWYAAEFDNGKAFRWSKRRGSVRLVPRPGTLVVEAAGGVPGDEQVLGVRVDGHLVGHGSLGHAWRTMRFAIPPEIPTDREVEIALEVNFALPPSIKGGDPRELGARVVRVAFEG
ncbi:MAG: glycosyltransferase family 4 protein [Planctomycetes bacterium]|nr:glycosyltransferase family 4 protein [Planctomycetota bacterium]